MRVFSIKMYKNLIGIYLFLLCFFSYHSMLDSIPNQIYLKKGENVEIECMVPVSVQVLSEDTEVLSDLSNTTYDSFVKRMEKIGKETLADLEIGNHNAMCYLLGVLPVKEVNLSVVEEKELYASGRVVGIYGATQGVLVLGTSMIESVSGEKVEPAENLLFAGDYIVAINDKKVSRKEDLVKLIQESDTDSVVLSLWRNEELIRVAIHPVKALTENDGEQNMLGIWVKDDMAGIGTLTYYSEDGAFGALGHGIGNGKTNDLLKISRGELYEANVLKIKKGERGVPGELQGVVYYGYEHRIGAVSSNSEIGIYGTLVPAFEELYKQTDTIYAIGYKQEIKTGKAILLSDASGEVASYEIRIDSLDYSPNDRNKGIRFVVEDEKLLSLTGGIVQGLSGSPIIQDGKIIGAVTHVLVNDPTRGYGIFIEEMLEH